MSTGSGSTSVRSDCAACGSRDLELILDLGDIPLAGAFPVDSSSSLNDRFPLTLRLCGNCLLLQVPEQVDPTILFADYRYLASVPLARHFEAYAALVPGRIGLNPTDLVVEIGCNDGVLLHPLHRRGFTNLVGIDPATNVTERIASQVPVINAFFGSEVARSVRVSWGLAQLVAANNVFAHVPDLHDFLDGVNEILAGNGTFVFEVHSAARLLAGNQFDTVYHEHRYYYSLLSLRPLLASHDLVIVDVELLENHGGSLRVFARRTGDASPAVRSALLAEQADGLDRPERYRRFASDVDTATRRLRGLVAEIAPDRIFAAYGAAGRAVTLLNYVPDVAVRLRYVVDDSEERHGRLIPGVRVPIVSAEELRRTPPDVVLITAWTYVDAIVRKVREALPEDEPAFIVPLPNAAHV